MIHISFLPVLWIFVLKGIPSKIRSVSKNNEIAYKKANFWTFRSIFSSTRRVYGLVICGEKPTDIDGLSFGFPDDIVAQKASEANG